MPRRARNLERRDEDTAPWLRAIIDSSDDAMVSKTLEGVIRSWNAAAETMFGWTAQEAVGRHITLIIPPERHAEEDEVLAKIRRGERVEHFQTVRVTKDGRCLDVSLTVSPVRNARGTIIGASKIARDISDRQRAEETRARLAAIVDSSDDAIVSKGLDGVITSWNRAAEKIFGWTASEAVGRHITLIIPAERRAEEEEVLAKIRRGERIDHFDTVRVTKDGRRLDISLTVSPLQAADGRIVGASKIARDVTERRRTEEERRRLLAREQAASRAKDEFLATVSHELRTPLSGVFGWARMLQSSEMDDKGRERAVAAIVRSAAAQIRLIDDLLDISRIITGNMRFDVMPVDLTTIIEAAVETVRPAATAKALKVLTAVDPAGTLVVMGAADRLQQVVWNLVMNAVKFTPRGGTVEIRLRRVDTDAEVVVRDTGEGISPDVLPYVFDRFRQEDGSTTRAHTGLGLGLALVRHIVDLHGGEVAAASPGKGQGATFTLRLPLAAAD